MENKEKQADLSYRIAQIYTLEFSFKDLDRATLEKFFDTPNSLALGTQTKVDINRKESNITIDIRTKLFEKEKEINVLVDHTGRTVFNIRGLEQVFNMEENTFELPDAFMAQLFGLAYSHARALLAVEISPTIYKDKYLLPVINPHSFLSNNQNAK